MNYEQLVTAIDVASQALLGRAAEAFNQALVLRNWLIGAHLIEFEQSGQDRATYGEQLLSNLAADLKRRGLKGLGMSMLKNCRRFYRFYPQIRQSLPGEFEAIPARPEIDQSAICEFDPDLRALPPEHLLGLSWPHFVPLTPINDPPNPSFSETTILHAPQS